MTPEDDVEVGAEDDAEVETESNDDFDDSDKIDENIAEFATESAVERAQDDIADIVLDEAGDLISRNELLVLTDDELLPNLDALTDLKQLSREAMPRLGSTLVRLLVPDHQNLTQALNAVRALLPDAAIDFNHSYELVQARAAEQATGAPLVAGRYQRPALATGSAYRVGMIDSSLALQHEALRQTDIVTRNFLQAGQQNHYQHATAVASLLVADVARMVGMLPQSSLYAAEVFYQDPRHGLIASSYSLIKALDWLAGEQVQVINMSLTGPANQVLEKALLHLLDSNLLIVAAAGNDGPAAAPRYPAAYDRVLAVTAVDASNRVYLRAVRGEHLDYAAPGVMLRAASATSDSSYQNVTGTSFATPLVTGLVLYYISQHGIRELDQLNALMRTDTLDLGDPGPDAVYGNGLLGASLLLDADTEQQ